jgi:hypothetical protein
MRLIVISILALTVLPGAVYGQNDSRDKKEIEDQIRQSWKEASSGNYDAVSMLDFGLTGDSQSQLGENVIAVASSDGGPWEISTATEQAKLLKDDDFVLHVRPHDVHILLIGSEKDVAYASYYLVGTISSSSNDVQDYHTRVSQVLEKINDKWVIRGAHYSRYMDAQGIPPSG